jgi:hypothetical protein
MRAVLADTNTTIRHKMEEVAVRAVAMADRTHGYIPVVRRPKEYTGKVK